MSDLRYYIVSTEVRDLSTSGTTTLGVIAASRDEAISKARSHARASSGYGRRVTKVISARLSERFVQKGART